ncbi:MAG: transcriptional repressor [Zetaproteobacteria bacterium]|nr:MAG: transcriptional repressor [Zetaproteobacteria bacterium]
MRLTRQRAAILRLINRSEGHWDAEGIATALQRRGERIGIATIYRGLQALERAGLVTALQIDGRKHYERADKRHHDHLICLHCGAIGEFCSAEIEALQQEIAAAHRFIISHHALTLYGRCRRCGAHDAGRQPPPRLQP